MQARCGVTRVDGPGDSSSYFHHKAVLVEAREYLTGCVKTVYNIDALFPDAARALLRQKL